MDTVQKQVTIVKQIVSEYDYSDRLSFAPFQINCDNNKDQIKLLLIQTFGQHLFFRTDNTDEYIQFLISSETYGFKIKKLVDESEFNSLILEYEEKQTLKNYEIGGLKYNESKKFFSL